MSNRRLAIFTIATFIFSVSCGIGFDYVYKLYNEVNRLQVIIKKNQSIDSLNCTKSNEYREVIEKYVTNDCGLLIDGKRVSLQNFVDLYQKKQDDLIESLDGQIGLQKENNLLKDSLNILNHQIKLINTNLGISLKSKKSDCSVVVGYESKKIDSALLLLKYFRDRLRYDSVDKSWIITR